MMARSAEPSISEVSSVPQPGVESAGEKTEAVELHEDGRSHRPLEFDSKAQKLRSLNGNCDKSVCTNALGEQAAVLACRSCAPCPALRPISRSGELRARAAEAKSSGCSRRPTDRRQDQRGGRSHGRAGRECVQVNVLCEGEPMTAVPTNLRSFLLNESPG